jgi:hypothetical protein
VWNFGIYAPTAQITDRTAFLVQGDGALEAGVSTPTGWMVAIEPGRMAVPRTAGRPKRALGWLPRIQCAKTSIHV